MLGKSLSSGKVMPPGPEGEGAYVQKKKMGEPPPLASDAAFMAEEAAIPQGIPKDIRKRLLWRRPILGQHPAAEHQTR